MRSFGPAVVLAAVALTACTSAVHGHGEVISPSSAGSSRAPSTAPATPSSASSSFAPPPDLVRAPAQTDIGDPVTADLCATVGLATFRNLRPGLTPAFDPVQYPPGCSVTESAGSAAVVQFSVFAETGEPPTASGRTTRTIAGETIYVYPFDAVSGACPRDIKLAGVLLTVDASPQGNATADEGLSCA
ncbi:MAG TPA: hypothetical protein VKB75_07585, partial [Jatrophihabitans sp.]|nr:hypothetical protein [Jatrophihabitans sp.]